MKKQMILDNIPTIKRIAKHYSMACNLSEEEILSYGYEGLIKAVLNYDDSLGKKFSSYLYYSVRNCIINGISSMDGAVGYKSSFYIKYLPIKCEIEDKYGKSIEECDFMVDEVVNRLVEDGEISDSRSYMTKSKILANLNISLSECDVINDESFNDIDFSMMNDDINMFLSTLNSMEEHIVRMRFGLNDTNERHTYASIGNCYGIRDVEVKNIYNNAMNKLKRNRKISALRCYLDLFSDDFSSKKALKKVKK